MAVRLRLAIFFLAFTFNAYHGLFSTWWYPSTDVMLRSVRLVIDAIYIGTALMVVWRNRSSLGVKLYVSFILFAILTIIYTYQRYSFSEQINGLRESLFFFATLVLVYDLYESSVRQLFVRVFTISLIVFALLQIPTTIVQFLKWGANDPVGGTYGIKGGSGYLTQVLFLICMYLMVRYASADDGENFRITRSLPFFGVLLPCAINETKISFFLLPVLFLLLIKSGRQLFRMLPFLAIGGVLMYVLVYYYAETVEDPLAVFNTERLSQYLYTSETHYGQDMPRFQRVTVMLGLMKDDIGTLALGMGYGAIGGGSYATASRFSRSIYYLVLGSRVLLFRAWIQGGFVAVVLFAIGMFGWLRTKVMLPHTIKQFRWFLIFSLLVIWLYNEAMIDRVFAPIACFFMIWIQNGGLQGELSESEETASEPPDESA
jgi:hypothetical protein